MNQARSITSSEAKASLGELLSSLATDGPVEITRNGRRVAVLSAPTAGVSPVEASRLAELARLYAAGKVTWREVSSEADIAFGDLLAELARQDLRLPRVMPSKRPEQLAMLHGIFERAVRR
jgi:antitoxin (DNA-binding transcriptional repressor) of toxin-antitoxin stability system